MLCYRAGESIGRVIEPLHELLEDSGIAYELVLVANFWPDEDDSTPAIVERFSRERRNARVVAQPKGGGMGWDMRSGLDAARGAYLVVMDGDAQNPVEDALRLYRTMLETGADVTKGRRVSRGDGLYRRVVSFVFNVLFRALFETRGLWDVNGKPKGLTRAAYTGMQLRSDDWFIDAEIVLAARRLGLRVVEVPVVFRRNDERASFVRVSAIGEFAVNMARQRLRGRS